MRTVINHFSQGFILKPTVNLDLGFVTGEGVGHILSRSCPEVVGYVLSRSCLEGGEGKAGYPNQAGADPGPVVGGAYNPSKGGPNLIYYVFFLKNVMKLKKFWSVEGVYTGSAP